MLSDAELFDFNAGLLEDYDHEKEIRGWVNALQNVAAYLRQGLLLA